MYRNSDTLKIGFLMLILLWFIQGCTLREIREEPLKNLGNIIDKNGISFQKLYDLLNYNPSINNFRAKVKISLYQDGKKKPLTAC